MLSRTLCAVLALVTAGTALAEMPAFPDARATDPLAMGWMQGSPPPADRLLRWSDMSWYMFPGSRWSFANLRQFVPTKDIWRGDGRPSELPRATRDEIDGISFTPLGSNETMTWEQSLAANYTDAILVLHKGRVVYERYFGVMTPHTQHMCMSVTKSFIGTLATMLVDQGKLDPGALVTKYIPELAGSAFGDATVRQVLDMTTAFAYSEKYSDPNADIWRYTRATGLFASPPGYDGPGTTYDFLKTLKKEGEHDDQFTYRTPNSEVIGWLIRRVTGKTVSDLLSESFWQKLGTEEDGYIEVDPVGTEMAGGGLAVTLRDLARFGEMMRLDGRFNGQQVVPKSVVDEIRRGGDKARFAKAGYKTLPGWSYHDQWWVSHNEDGAYSARGVHGQVIYIDPKAEMVIARFSSFPVAANAYIDPTSLPAYQAVADHLMKVD
jgi:CubicO group peptidase (beta-lactamase class C family)